jgi:CheY-like chemotaxis protein
MHLVGVRQRHRLVVTLMLDHAALKWIASTSTNLNSMLQQIARYTDLARRHPENHHYIDLVGERVDLASRTAQALFDRITYTILENTAVKAANRRKGSAAPFTVLPFPTPAPAPSQVTADLLKFAPSSATLRPAEPEASPTEEPQLNIKNPSGPRELVLVVEDEHEVAEMAASMLAEEGYKVILASDGFEALKIYQGISQQIGLVILDFFLPVLDGDGVFDELRAINPDVNVVLSSGFAEQHKISAMLNQGLRGFIPKPYTREKLVSQVRSTLDAGRQSTRS